MDLMSIHAAERTGTLHQKIFNRQPRPLSGAPAAAAVDRDVLVADRAEIRGAVHGAPVDRLQIARVDGLLARAGLCPKLIVAHHLVGGLRDAGGGRERKDDGEEPGEFIIKCFRIQFGSGATMKKENMRLTPFAPAVFKFSHMTPFRVQ